MSRSIRTLVFLIMFAVALVPFQPALGADKNDAQRADVLRKVRVLFEDGDSFQAIQFLSALGEPKVVAERYEDVVKDLYWKERAIPPMVTVARAGIQYCLTKAQEVEKEDPELAVHLRSSAKTNAYNLASFTWPGWEEKGIVLSEADLVAGLDAARLNLRLAIELDKGALRVSMAHWALGAQLMAAGRHEEAVEAFTLSREKAHAALDKLYEMLALGYVGVAKILSGSQRADGEKDLETAMEELREFKGEDGQFCINQLETAMRVFGEEKE
jgi:tetratricopeptide (TPR) repeat protein